RTGAQQRSYWLMAGRWQGLPTVKQQGKQQGAGSCQVFDKADIKTSFFRVVIAFLIPVIFYRRSQVFHHLEEFIQGPFGYAEALGQLGWLAGTFNADEVIDRL